MAFIIGGVDLSQPFSQSETILLISGMILIGLLIIMVSIFYILREIRLLKSLVGKVKSLVHEVKADLKTFSNNLTRLENLGRPKKVYAMRRFIKSSLAKGVPWPEIEESLLSQGWDKQTVRHYRR